MKVTANDYARLLVNVSQDVAGDKLKERVSAVLELMEKRGDGHMANRLLRELDSAYASQVGGGATTVKTAEGGKELFGAIASILKTHEEDIEHLVDESLIAGAVVRVDNTIVDASLKGRLTQLKRKLTA